MQALLAHARGGFATRHVLLRLRLASSRQLSHALASWMEACALRLAHCQRRRRTVQLLVARLLRGAWSTLRSSGAERALRRSSAAAFTTTRLLRAVNSWRLAAVEAGLAVRALTRRQHTSLGTALVTWRGGAAVT